MSAKSGTILLNHNLYTYKNNIAWKNKSQHNTVNKHIIDYVNRTITLL